MITTNELMRLRREDWAELLRRGFPIDPEQLDNSMYKGISIGLPEWMERLSWKTFRKVFHRDPNSHALRGWNVRMQQNGIDAPNQPLERKGQPWTFGHYLVGDLDDERSPEPIRNGLLLDYTRGGNSAFDPVSRLRDPIVALQRNNVQRLLGWSYVVIGPARVPTPSFFILEREGPLDHIAVPPNARSLA